MHQRVGRIECLGPVEQCLGRFEVSGHAGGQILGDGRIGLAHCVRVGTREVERIVDRRAGGGRCVAERFELRARLVVE